MSQESLINVCGLWKHQTNQGEEYYSGTLGGAKILIFKNRHKQEERHPDFNMCMAPKQKPPVVSQSQPEQPEQPDNVPF